MHLMILLYSHFSSTEIEFHMRDCVKPFKSFSLLVVISHSKWKASCKKNLHTKIKKSLKSKVRKKKFVAEVIKSSELSD